MTIQMYAKRKNWKIPSIEVHVSHSKLHMEDCEDCESAAAKIDTFNREIWIGADLDEKQISRLMEIADKCPVHRTLHSTMQVITRLRK
jgi:putative redox protein